MNNKIITIIGAGPGGYVAAIKAAQVGFDVNIIEKGPFGGTCLNIGCIPTKAILYPLSFLNKNYNRMGIMTDKMKIDLNKLNMWKKGAVNKAVKGVELLLKKYDNIKIYKGEGKLINNNEIEVNGEKIKTDYTILAMGSIPSIPKIFDVKGVWTSDNALELNEIPEILTIIGAGVIGVEIGFIYNKLGSKVTLIDVLDHVGGLNVDEDISSELEKILRGSGIDIKLNVKVSKIEKNKIVLENGEVIETSKIMLAMGRRAMIPQWVEESGIKIAKNKIVIDEKLKTTMENVFAIGDLIDGPMLAHKAMHDAVKVINNLEGKENKEYPIPSVIYTHPEIASIGMIEKEAREKYGDEIKISKFPYSANARANCTKELKGFVKLISFNNKLLGAHIVGENSSEMIWGFGVIMGNALEVSNIENMVFPHPTFAESIHEAILGINSNYIHI
ncbi:dihydrolipoyl dehydrogenase [bacterium]|nr:dihydrolipoyl dehydrogenase [bacterium]